MKIMVCGVAGRQWRVRNDHVYGKNCLLYLVICWCKIDIDIAIFCFRTPLIISLPKNKYQYLQLIHLYKVFTRLESAVPAKFVSNAPTFFGKLALSIFGWGRNAGQHYSLNRNGFEVLNTHLIPLWNVFLEKNKSRQYFSHITSATIS